MLHSYPNSIIGSLAHGPLNHVPGYPVIISGVIIRVNRYQNVDTV